MKTQSPQTQFPLKKLLLAGAILLILGFVYTVSAYQFKLWPFSTNTPSETSPDYVSPEERGDNNDTKKDLIENNDDTYNGTPSGDASDIVITTQQESGSLTILTKLYGYSDGQCSLTATNGTRTIKQTAAVIFQAEYSTCAGFSVNIDQLGTGTWNLTLTVTSKGIPITKQLSVEVK